MKKIRSADDQQLVATLLRKHREASGLTQIDVAQRIRDTQSYVSKCERGDRRLDLGQLRAFCQAIGIPLTDFVKDFERLASRQRR